jgi:DNA-binding HxlR family transcriptional regulator
MPYRRKRSAPDPCPVEIVVSIVSGKWKARVLYLLAQEDLTFGEIRASVGSVSQQVLSNLLRELEADKVVERTRTDSALTSGYRLTPKGRQLFHLLLPLADWGNQLLSGQGVRWDPPLPIRKQKKSPDRCSNSIGGTLPIGVDGGSNGRCGSMPMKKVAPETPEVKMDGNDHL